MTHIVDPPAGLTVPGPAPQFTGPRTAPRYNLFALIAFLGCFVVPVVGIVFGHIAVGQVNARGEPGRGFARAGLILGYTFTALGAILVIVYIGMFAAAIAAFGAASSPYGY
ncbi:DUF4190 domain-containing protein [Microbacterium sp. Leaf320]|uniref:DUF4190 domain-containing protein n=1 Tax=Microbacterium sp. Leaf320 TaxID=1736334 RepID=UPI0006FCEAE2|nr:DUF4190 domain-containing protein [Microbacterium sp. Leaf320]KQQ65385.1 hypothetical protein ASF63_15730 [Microbacterium sp. Leaf320]